MTDQYFRPRNWDKHQGYRKRGATWVKHYTALLSDPDYTSLTPNCRATLHGLWLLTGLTGRPLPLNSRFIGAQLSMDSRATGVALKILLSSNFIELCGKSVALYATQVSQDSPVTKTEDIDDIEESRVDPPIAPPKGTRPILTDLADWSPSSEDRAYAEQHNLDPGRVLSDIQDWAANAPASKRRKKDPSRFWQTWCRREADRRPIPHGKPNGTGPPGVVAMVNELNEEYRRQQNGNFREDHDGAGEVENHNAPALPRPG